ncbi:hypothetical protein O6P43_031845 [Quillaja saponaria]|uniref:Uncharacterized protein n=1 Tax=Quillaja saponaria TaxID=32244 RepID=A0AAD7KW33_QUISA|nr:hypothetical protein O6P43_031845 [Quillaja saponaria]
MDCNYITNCFVIFCYGGHHLLFEVERKRLTENKSIIVNLPNKTRNVERITEKCLLAWTTPDRLKQCSFRVLVLIGGNHRRFNSSKHLLQFSR